MAYGKKTTKKKVTPHKNPKQTGTKMNKYKKVSTTKRASRRYK